MFSILSVMKAPCGLVMSSPLSRRLAQSAAHLEPAHESRQAHPPFHSLQTRLRRQLCLRQLRQASTYHAPCRPVRLKDGRTAQIRPLIALDKDKLDDFLDRADFLGAGGAIAYRLMGKAQARQYELTHILGRLTDVEHGILVAEVDGRIEGLCEFEPLHGADTEAGLASLPSFRDLHACVSSMSVARNAQGLGIGSALKQAQMQWAARAGYQAIVGETAPSNQAMLHIVSKLGGKLVEDGAGPARTLIPLPTTPQSGKPG